MRKWIAMLLILGAVLTLTAKDYELKQAVDKNGCLAVTADDEIRIIVEGAGEFLGAGNGIGITHCFDTLMRSIVYIQHIMIRL